MSTDTKIYLPFFTEAAAQSDEVRRRVSKVVARSCGLPHSTVLALLRSADADRMMRATWTMKFIPIASTQ